MFAASELAIHKLRIVKYEVEGRVMLHKRIERALTAHRLQQGIKEADESSGERVVTLEVGHQLNSIVTFLKSLDNIVLYKEAYQMLAVVEQAREHQFVAVKVGLQAELSNDKCCITPTTFR